MKRMPLSMTFVRSRRVNRDSIEGGRFISNDTTQDGTVDVYGLPASKRRSGGWKGASFIIAEQVAANLAYFGVSSNLIIYLTTVMHESNSQAAKNVANWNGTGFIAPLLVAYVADAYSGRFLGAVVSSAIYVVGLAMLTVAGSLQSFRPPQCPSEDLNCQEPSLSQVALLYGSLYAVDLGAGGVQGTVVTFGADQFDEEDEREKLQKSSFFNWAFQTIFAGSFISSTFFVYLQENVSVGLGWGISCGVQILGTIILVMGVRLYRYHNPVGNPLVRIAQVITASFRKRHIKVLSIDDFYELEDAHSAKIQGSRRILHSKKFQFLDKAAVVTDKDKEHGVGHDPWFLCAITQVEEVKFVLRVLPIFLTSIMYTACYSQMSTLFVEQGSTMDRNLGSFVIPAASIGVFESISVLLWVVVYDQLLVPFVSKRTGNRRGISELQRIGIGLALSIFAMIIAALVEVRRLHVVHVHGLWDDPKTPVPMSVFWEFPQYFVMGASEVFTSIGLMEFFYDQAPDAIRSLGFSLSLLTNSLGFFVSTFLLTIVGRISKRGGRPGWVANNLNLGRIDLFYWVLAVLSFINLVAFILYAQQYEYVVFQQPVTSKSKLPKEENDQQRQVATPQPPGLTKDSYVIL